MSWRKIYSGQSEPEKQDPESIYCLQNPYAYHINIRQPVAAYFFEQYKKEVGAGSFPLSDAERHDFERRFLNWIANNNLEIAEGGRLPEVSMVEGKPVIDTEKRNQRIQRIIEEEGEYKPHPAFDVPAFVTEQMAEKRGMDAEKFSHHAWERI